MQFRQKNSFVVVPFFSVFCIHVCDRDLVKEVYVMSHGTDLEHLDPYGGLEDDFSNR